MSSSSSSSLSSLSLKITTAITAAVPLSPSQDLLSRLRASSAVHVDYPLTVKLARIMAERLREWDHEGLLHEIETETETETPMQDNTITLSLVDVKSAAQTTESLQADAAVLAAASSVIKKYILVLMHCLIHEEHVTETKIERIRIASQLIEIALGLIPVIPFASDSKEMALRLYCVMSSLLVSDTRSTVISHVLLTKYFSNILSGLMDLCLYQGGMLDNDNAVKDNRDDQILSDSMNHPSGFLKVNIASLPEPRDILNLLVDRIQKEVLLRTFLAVLESRSDVESKHFCGDYLTTIILRDGGIRHFFEEFVRINSFHGTLGEWGILTK